MMENKKNKITPKEYAEILNCIELQNIYLIDMKASINHDQISEDMEIAIKDSAVYQNIEDGFTVKNKYTITAKNQKKENVLKIECMYNVVFKSTREINGEFFEIYKDISLPLNVWPFVRELVNTTTARMYIRPLILPLLKK